MKKCYRLLAALLLVPVTAQSASLAEQALSAFEAGQLDVAEQQLNQVLGNDPKSSLARYYLGAIALQKQDWKKAERHWQRYMQLDRKQAAADGIPAQLTLIKQKVLTLEIQQQLANEASLAESNIEDNSIAVMNFRNRGNPRYDMLAKGMTAFVITDLHKATDLKVLERDKMQLISDELKLSGTGLVDEASRLRAGRLMQAERLVFGEMQVK